MKVILLELGGAAGRARKVIQEHFDQCEVESLSRSDFESGATRTLIDLRRRRPDVFAVATERLAWQRGTNAFFLLGSLAGAQTTIILDGHGGWLKESRSRVFFAAARVASEAVRSAAIIARAHRELRKLESEVKESASLKPPGKKSRTSANTYPRITYLRATPGPGTQAGGAASHIKGVLEGLIELGAKVEIISNDALAGLDEKRLQLKVITPEPLGATRAVFDVHNNDVFTRGALSVIETQATDFIYQRYARFSWAGVVAALQTKRPLFLEYNGSEVWVGRHWDRVNMLDLLERFERLNLAAATRIFVVSQVERNNLERAGVAPEKIIVNPNGVDPTIFRPDVGGAAQRNAFGVRPDEQLVGFVGTFGPWHGVLVLARAIKLIPKEVPVRFLLVGTGALHGEMQELLAAEQQSGRVIFRGGVPHDQIPAMLDACDVLVSPHVPLAEGAEFFGSPTKLFEYMAMGKGIVASRLGQIADVLKHEETALLVSPGNAQELSAAIIRLAESRSLRQTLGAAARSTAVANHTWTRNAQNILDAYQAWRDGARET